MNKKVFVYDPTSSDKLSSVRGIGRYIQILKENFSNEFEFVSQIKNWKLKIENSVFINPFFNFLQPPLTLKKIAQKQIAVIHDLIPLKYPSHFPAGIKGSIYILLNKLSLKNYDLIITDSKASKKDIIKILGVEEGKIKVVYPCLPKIFTISNNQFTISKQISNPFCLYVGDATWNKNLVNLALAIKMANINCMFVGKVFSQPEKVASEKALREVDCRDNRQSLTEEKSHERLNLSHPWQHELNEFNQLTKNDKRFIFAGFIPDFELIKLYQQALVNILPSRDEGFGFSYVESSQFGCPSLLSNIPILREISDGKAIFFDPKNPNDIANKICEINSDKILRNKIKVDSKKRSKFFSPKKFKKEFLKILMS